MKISNFNSPLNTPRYDFKKLIGINLNGSLPIADNFVKVDEEQADGSKVRKEYSQPHCIFKLLYEKGYIVDEKGNGVVLMRRIVSTNNFTCYTHKYPSNQLGETIQRYLTK